jgi:hypothetical protein
MLRDLEKSSACLAQHPAVAYFFLVRPRASRLSHVLWVRSWKGIGPDLCRVYTKALVLHRVGIFQQRDSRSLLRVGLVMDFLS